MSDPYLEKIGREKELSQEILKLREEIKNLKADDAKEGVEAFIDKRNPNWKNNIEKKLDKSKSFQVDSVHGYSMLILSLIHI